MADLGPYCEKMGRSVVPARRQTETGDRMDPSEVECI
jgi:hypothetical protein